MKDNTDMFFVKDMAVSDYDKFFGTTDGGFNMCVEGCAPGHEGIIPLGTVVLNDTPFLAYRSTKFQKYIFLFCVSFSLYSPSNLPRLF